MNKKEIDRLNTLLANRSSALYREFANRLIYINLMERANNGS